jgi:outer membrane lipoprotein LolB
MRYLIARLWAALAILMIAGCAIFTRPTDSKSLENSSSELSQRYVGRLSFVVEAAPGSLEAAQSFSGSFELSGNPQAGQLDLLSPLGQIVMQLLWQPGQAEILRGKDRQQFASAQILLEQATGAALTLTELFAWLSGNNSLTQAGSWQVDLSSHAQGRIVARRIQPTPAVLRIVLEQP